MIYFIADIHYGHHNIIMFCGRPYESVEYMNEDLVVSWVTTVNDNDTVYLLGDVAMSRKLGLEFFDQVNGKIVLISGNHDQKFFHTYSQHPRVVEVRDTLLLKHNHRQYWLSHYPHISWPNAYRGSIHLYGHVHGTLVGKDLGTEGRSMDVGVDVIGPTPISIEEVNVRFGL